MINPRDGYGYGIIHIARELAEHIAPLADIRQTDTQGYLEDSGVFEQLRKWLWLPDGYTVVGLFFNGPYMRWDVCVEAKDIPRVKQGDLLPTVLPVYEMLFEQGVSLPRLKSISVMNECSVVGIDDLKDKLGPITKEQAEAAFHERRDRDFEIRNLEITQIKGEDVPDYEGNQLGVFDVEDVAWKCTFEKRRKLSRDAEYNRLLHSWRPATCYVVQAVAKPEVIDD